jgi:hypothetical protein
MKAGNTNRNGTQKRTEKDTKLRRWSGLRWCGGRPPLIASPPILATSHLRVWIGRRISEKALERGSEKQLEREKVLFLNKFSNSYLLINILERTTNRTSVLTMYTPDVPIFFSKLHTAYPTSYHIPK